MENLITFLPFVGIAIIVVFTEILHHRKVTDKVICNYGKDSKHKENNPELYTKEYVISDIKDMRSKSYSVILLYLALFMFFGMVMIGEETLSKYKQNPLFVIMLLLFMVIYAATKWTDSKKTKLVLLSVYATIAGILFLLMSVLFNGDYSPSDTQAKTISSEITDNTVTTKSGSEWKITDQKDTYYHVVKYGESLEYIFNDIYLSLQKAQEQQFNILKKDDKGKFEIIPQSLYGYELNQKTYLYSGLNPGNTVYLQKHELDKFIIEKHVVK